MRKLFLMVFTLIFTSMASAEYSIRVPLEVNEGGSLPNGSIVFNQNEVPTPPTPPAPGPENWTKLSTYQEYGCQNYGMDETSEACRLTLYSSDGKRVGSQTLSSADWQNNPDINKNYNYVDFYFDNLTVFNQTTKARINGVECNLTFKLNFMGMLGRCEGVRILEDSNTNQSITIEYLTE
jgi:hypothetical protein